MAIPESARDITLKGGSACISVAAETRYVLSENEREKDVGKLAVYVPVLHTVVEKLGGECIDTVQYVGNNCRSVGVFWAGRFDRRSNIWRMAMLQSKEVKGERCGEKCEIMCVSYGTSICNSTQRRADALNGLGS